MSSGVFRQPTQLKPTVEEEIPVPRILFAATVAVTVRAFLLPIARHFRDLGWRVDALASGIEADEKCRQGFDEVWDASWSRNPLDPRNLRAASKLRNLVEGNGYDLVHAHTPVASFVTRYALDGLRHERGLKVIYTAHGFHFHPAGGAVRNRIFEMLERRAARWTDYLIVMNRHDFQAASEKALVPPNRLLFMPGIGVDRMVYSPSAVTNGKLEQVCEELQITPECPALLMLAEFVERKRHQDVIRAFAKLGHRQCQLILGGDGPLVPSMKRLAAQLGVADRVRFLGNRNDVPALMKASRALVLASTQEGLPRCILEALSMGVPVIGSRIRGVTDLLEQNGGLLFNIGDVDGLASAMKFLLDDPIAASAMGQAGRKQSQQYDLEHVVRMHEGLYKEALAKNRSSNSVRTVA